jgi:oligopeptide transport system substrate-binding protein
MFSFLCGFVWSFVALAPMQSPPDEFVFNNSAEPETLDPHRLSGSYDSNITNQIFEGLMSRGADWATVVPGQAETYSVSADGKTYTFRLRPQLKWSDGSPLTAKDFEYSFLRLMDPATASTYAYWFTDSVEGGQAFAKNPTTENRANVKVRAIDDRTLSITLSKPVPYFLQLVAETPAFPVKREVVEKFKDAWIRPENIVSNGPFRLAEWKVNDRIVMEKNPHYFAAQKVKLNRAVALPISDKQTAVNLFRQGRLDWSGPQGAPGSLVAAYRSDPQFRVHPAFITYFYRLNVTRPPLNDVRVRQALTLAINRQELVERVTRGGELATSVYVPPKVGDSKSVETLVGIDHKQNVARAKQLLAEAGFPNGKGFPAMELLYNSDETHKRVALAIQQMWKKELGVDIRLFNQEWKVYLQKQQMLDFSVSRAGWAGDYPDAATFLEIFLSDSGNNQTGWKNAEYDRLFAAANKQMNVKARNEMMAQAESILLREAPIIPLFFYTNFGFLRPEVLGFEPNLIDRPFLRYISKQGG